MPTGRKRSTRRYCGACDEWMAARHLTCPKCGLVTDRAEPEEDRRYEDAVDSGMAGDALVLERDR